MTETQTLSDRRGQAQAAIEETSARLEELADAHAGLSLAAFEGDKEAIARVAQIDEEIAEAERSRRLAEDALVEIEALEREAESAAREARCQELEGRYDELVGERRKALQKFERALNSLGDAADAVLGVDAEQRAIALDIGLTGGSVASCELPLRDRTLTKLSALLGSSAGPTTPLPVPLTEDTGILTQTVGEAATRKQEGIRQAEEEQNEAARIHAAIERREEIGRRRDQLLAGAGYATAHPSQRPAIEAEVEEALAQEFGTAEEA